MGRHRTLRAVKICPICAEGYDAFKARDARGRFCSPGCLAEARRRQRGGVAEVAPSEIPGEVGGLG
jgi:hypothetical protein